MRKIVSFLVAATLLAPAAWARTEPATWVKRILAEYDSISRKQGWTPEGAARPGSLASGGEARLEFDLEPRAYRFVVVCEPACGAGEVELFDPAGSRVGEPGALVDMPKIEASPAAPGRYALRVTMTDCAAEVCAWSARLYAKR